MLDSLYTYKAEVIEVIDGDTVDLAVSLGLNCTYTDRFRFYGINAWEKRGAQREAGIVAKNFLESIIPPGTKIYIRTVLNNDEKDSKGKYGRFLVQDLRPVSGPYSDQNLLGVMVKEGHAEVKHY